MAAGINEKNPAKRQPHCGDRFIRGREESKFRMTLNFLMPINAIRVYLCETCGMIQQNWLMLAKLSLAVVAVLLPRLEAAAQGARYEIFPEPQVRQGEKYRVNSAYVVDKKESQFWICTARYHHHSGEANQGECTRLPAEVGRPTLTRTTRSGP